MITDDQLELLRASAAKAKANGDPEKYLAGLTVQQAHDITSALAELQSLRSARMGSEVEVKPLEWSEIIPGRMVADIYMVERSYLDEWRLLLRADRLGGWPRFFAGPFTLEEAKAAAQADFNIRILSTLTKGTENAK